VDFERGSLPRQASGDSQTRSEEVNGSTGADLTLSKSTSVKTQRSPQRPRTTSNIDKALPPTPGDIKRQKSHKTAPRSILDYGDYETRPSVEGRLSSQSARPSPRDLYDAYGYKQKVKYGPRPSIESVGRPKNMDRSNDFRPVSTLPAGLRMPTTKSVPPPKTGPGQARPQSQPAQRAFPGSLSSQETLRAAPVTPIQIPDQNSSAISNGLLTLAETPAEAKSLKITPQKRRLMKALQLRQKQLAAQQPTNGPQIEEVPAEPHYTKPEVDYSILSAIVDTSNPEVDPDLVHVAVKDLSKEEPRNFEASPISLLDTSEGPSTQASSITDGEDIAAQKEQEKNATERPVLPGSASIRSDDPDEDAFRQSVMAQGNSAGQGLHEPFKDSAINGLNNATEIDEPAELACSGVHEALTGQGYLRQETKRTALADDAPTPAAIPFSAFEKEPSTKDLGNDLEEALPPSFVETFPAVAGSFSLPEEDDISTNSTGGKRQTLGSRQSKASETIPTQHTETPTARFNDKEQAAAQFIPPKISASSVEVGMPMSAAAATHHHAEGQPEALRGKSALFHHAVSTPVNHVSPQEVPLPPIDDDEEVILGTHRASVEARPVSQQPAAKIEPRPMMSQAQVSDVVATRPSTSDILSGQQADSQLQRRGVFDTPKRVSSPEHSDEHFLSDDSFMEELKCATVQEAKPISVSRSPIKPAFSMSESEQKLVDTTRASRSVSSPLNPPSKDEEVFSSTRLPSSSSSRSFSASHSLRPDNQQVPVIPKKIGVSSGISQRIKALEQISSRPISPQSGAPSNTSQSITLRKISVRTPPGASESNNILNSRSRPATGYPSPSPSPEAVKSNPLNSLTKANYSRPESISVTATIVRDARTKSPEIPVNLSEPRAMELHQSPLVVEHQRIAPTPPSPLKPPRPRYARYPTARSGSASSTEQKLDAPQTVRRDSFASMRSKSSRASEVDLPPRSLSDSSLMSGLSSLDDIKDEKKHSKRSRLMKRMSSISTMSRRSIAHALSPSPKEAPIMERQESIAETPSKAVDVGDVNVQFPDTLVEYLSTFLGNEADLCLALEATAHGRR